MFKSVSLKESVVKNVTLLGRKQFEACLPVFLTQNSSESLFFIGIAIVVAPI